MLRSLTVSVTSLGPGSAVGLKAKYGLKQEKYRRARRAQRCLQRERTLSVPRIPLDSLCYDFFSFFPDAEPGRRLAAKLRVHVVPSYLGCKYVKKCPVISVKRRQKAAFLSPIMSKITVTKDKERRKREEKTKKKWLHS